MAVAVTIAGIDRTASVIFPSLRKTDNLNQQIDTCEFSVDRYGPVTYVPDIGESVVVTRDGNTLFGGVIVRITETVEAANKLLYKVECVDYAHYLKRQLVTSRYEHMTVDAIVADLIADYTTDGFTTTNTTSSQIIESISFNRITVANALQKLADAISYVWYVDYLKDIHFFPKATERAPFDLSDTAGRHIYDSLEIVEDISQLRNGIVVQGGETVSATARTEYQSGDGTRTQFPLANKYDQRPTVTVGGLPKTVGIDYLDDDATFQVMWNFNEKYLRFTAGNTPTSGTNNISVSGTYLYPIVVSVPSLASQSTYGKYEHAITDKSIRSQGEAISRAQAELTGYSSTLYEGRFRTYSDGLRSGQVITIASAQRGRSIDVLIQSVSLQMRDPLGVQLEYAVRFATVKTVGIIEYLQEQLRSREVIVDDEEILLNYYAFDDASATTDSLAAPIKATGPYLWGTAKWGYSTWG